jgi:cell division inhibitor SepF
MEPKSFEEMPRVIQSLRDRKSVVLNLTMMDAAQAQRAVDFVAGATFTIDGHQERVGESIFLFTPNCVQVRTQAVPPQETQKPVTTTSNISTTSWHTEPLEQIAQ